MDNGVIFQKKKMKNKHNLEVGSEIERSDDRIKLTAEVFTPLELCEKLIDENIPEDELKNSNSIILTAAFVPLMVVYMTFLAQRDQKLFDRYESIQQVEQRPKVDLRALTPKEVYCSQLPQPHPDCTVE
jgi:hypothetical protein